MLSLSLNKTFPSSAELLRVTWCCSVHRPPPHVGVDGRLEDPRAVHGRLRALHLLAHPAHRHRPLQLDSQGLVRHPQETQRVGLVGAYLLVFVLH